MLWKFVIAALALATGFSPVDAQNSAGFVKGAPVVGGSAVPARLDINALQSAGGPQWDLYIRAVRSMYNAKPSDPLSFFQVAGIHGKPFVQWNGGGGRRTDGWLGYCPHGEPLFLSWHRPFMALYEQILVAHAVRLAKLYPSKDRARYVRAAETLRAPYWDWATSDIPNAVVNQYVKVRVPNDKGNGLKTINMKNPLYTYDFPKPALDGAYGQWDDERRSRIYRCPNPQRFPGSANTLLNRRNYKQMVYDVMTHSNSFDQFASTGASGASLEQIHNAIHWDAACGGQFLAAEFSAFDPIFMLHHCNVDRLWAYWQFMHPSRATFTNTYSGGSRYSTPSGTRIGPNSPLNPFFRSKGKFHTPDSVKSIRTFGYTYAGLEYWRMNPSALASSARQTINRLYGPTSPRRRDIEGRAEEKTTRFFAKVELDVTEVERPCSVDLFVAGKRVGGLVVMKQPETGIIHGEFSVDQAADTPQMLDSCTPNTVADSINNGLTAEIVRLDGSKIPVTSVPSLKVSLVDVPYTPPANNDDLPEYGKARNRKSDVKTKKKNPSKALNRCPRKLPSFDKDEPTSS